LEPKRLYGPAAFFSLYRGLPANAERFVVGDVARVGPTHRRAFGIRALEKPTTSFEANKLGESASGLNRNVMKCQERIQGKLVEESRFSGPGQLNRSAAAWIN
jgi:hypothetical protein